MQRVTEAIPVLFGSIVVVSVMTRYTLLHSMYDFKAAWSCGLIREHMLYEFELGYKPTQVTKNFYWAQREGAVDHSILNRLFKKFCSGWKNLDNQKRSVRPESEGSEAMHQVTVVNPARSTRRVSGKFGISQSSVIR